MSALHSIARSLFDGLGMFWITLWALVLGFGLSGAVQAFASRSAMQRVLGDHRPRTIAKAGLLGMASSSCSYAASALAKTLFARGADFTASQAFMFASTNLVVELGLVLWLLVSWQLAVAEITGGIIMVAVLAFVLPRVVPERESAAARNRLGDSTAASSLDPAHGAHVPPESTTAPWRKRARTLAGWSDAAGYTISDLTMLRKELVIGFVIAGFADVAVPLNFWRSLFLTGHGFGSSLENAVLGPFLAIISFVCSVGNVPLAAALWSGGISFGGVVAFVFADLITLPLLLIYRKYYGTRLTVKLLGVFWAVMSLSGLAVGELFAAAGLVPRVGTARHGTVGQNAFAWNYTTALDIVAVLVFVALYLLYRNRERFGGGTGYAKDPVCGMQVEVEHSPAVEHHGRVTYHFCSDHCHQRFIADPDRFITAATSASSCAGEGDADDARGHGRDHGHGDEHDRGLGADPDGTVDPVCGMVVDPENAAASAEFEGAHYFFCHPGCREAFVAEPERYALT